MKFNNLKNFNLKIEKITIFKIFVIFLQKKFNV